VTGVVPKGGGDYRNHVGRNLWDKLGQLLGSVTLAVDETASGWQQPASHSLCIEISGGPPVSWSSYHPMLAIIGKHGYFNSALSKNPPLWSRQKLDRAHTAVSSYRCFHCQSEASCNVRPNYWATWVLAQATARSYVEGARPSLGTVHAALCSLLAYKRVFEDNRCMRGTGVC